MAFSDTQMLVTTYASEYTVFGVSTDAYTVRPEERKQAEVKKQAEIKQFLYENCIDVIEFTPATA